MFQILITFIYNATTGSVLEVNDKVVSSPFVSDFEFGSKVKIKAHSDGYQTFESELTIDHYVNTKIPEHIMNGCWSQAPKISTGSGPENEGMFFGFWAGEILRGLGLFLQVQNNVK